MNVISCLEDQIVLLPDDEKEKEILESIALHGTLQYVTERYFFNSPIDGALIMNLNAPFQCVPTPEHTCEEDFQHFLSYSGMRNRSDLIINDMRKAFEAAWEPHRPPTNKNGISEISVRNIAREEAADVVKRIFRDALGGKP